MCVYIYIYIYIYNTHTHTYIWYFLYCQGYHTHRPALTFLSTNFTGFREAPTSNVSFISSFIIVVLMNIFGDGSKPQWISPSQRYNTQYKNHWLRGYNQRYRNLSITKIQPARQEPPKHEDKTSSTKTCRSLRYKLQGRNLPNMRIKPAVQEPVDH